MSQQVVEQIWNSFGWNKVVLYEKIQSLRHVTKLIQTFQNNHFYYYDRRCSKL